MAALYVFCGVKLNQGNCRSDSRISLIYHGFQKSSVPWKHVWTSLPFYAILLSHMFSNFGWYMLLIETPIYYDQVLKLPMYKVQYSYTFMVLFLYTYML